ncbi:MAG: GNAT family N-acetyltransferase [Bacteroidetes bacterium]|nr:GNAT family N-acetyltransferase [Bacteroidota bacterium]
MQTLNVKEFVPEEIVGDKSVLLPAFLEIWNAPENLKYLSFTLKPFEQEIVSFWLDNHKEQGGRYFCALNNKDEILGILVIKVNPVDGFEIYGLGVRPVLKRQGIGCELITHAIGVAEDLGFKNIDALVFADNAGMLRLLLTLGFIPSGMEHHKRADGADTVLLKKYI